MNEPFELLAEVIRDEKPHKGVRGVSVQGWRDERDKVEKLRQFFLRKLAAYRNRYQHWPTGAELVDWTFRLKELDRNDPSIFRRRATECVESGICSYGPKRRCRVTKRTAATIVINEIGAERGR